MAKGNNKLKTIGIIVVGLIIGVFVVRHATKKNVVGETPVSKAARSYMTDISVPGLKQRIIAAIMALARDRDTVLQNMDLISQTVEQHKVHLDGIINDRRTGQLTSREYKERILTVINEVAAELGIELRERIGLTKPANYMNIIKRENRRNR